MKKNIILNIFVFSLFLVGISLLYAETKQSHEPNVIKVDKDGNKIALCGCGQEVKVTSATAKVVDGDDTYYVCSDKCQQTFSQNLSKMKPALQLKVEKAKAKAGTMGNVYHVGEDGAMTAVCACGKDVKVSDKTVSRTWNGETYYLCSDGCAAQFDKTPAKVAEMSKKQVMKKELAKKEMMKKSM